MRAYRLPNGESTSNAKTYHAKWSDLADLVASKFGQDYKVYAFDPGISIRKGDTSVLVHLPGRAALDLVGN